MRHIYCRSMLWVLLIVCGCTLLASFSTAVADEGIVVDLLVNVLKDVTISDEDITSIVQEANKILKGAEIRLEFDTQNIQRDFNDQGNNNAKIEQGEDNALDKKGVEELAKKFGPGRGYKIFITNEIHGSAVTAGLSPHDPDMPVTYLNPALIKGAAARGNDLAHEFCHIFTLGKGHVHDDHDTPDPGDDEKADRGGHTDDKKNLMYPYNNGDDCKRGGELTDDQKREIRDKAKKRARVKPDQARNLQHSWFDESQEVSEMYIDLFTGTFFAEDRNAALEVVISLLGRHPAGTPVHSQFSLFFNTDNNDNTGIMAAGQFPGIDKVVFIELNGTYPFQTSGAVRAFLVDVATPQQRMPLEPGIVERIYKIRDVLPDNRPTTRNIRDAIQQRISLPLLQIPPQVPVLRGGIQSFDFATQKTDVVGFGFQLQSFFDTFLEISVASGRTNTPIQVQGSHFTPDSAYQLLLDDTQVGTGMVAADGTLATEFLFPRLPGGNYFVTARDAAGKSDFAVFTSLNDLRPGATLLGILGGPPRVLEIAFRDQDSGLQSMQVMQATNVQVDVPSFPLGTLNPVVVNAAKIDQRKNGRLKLQVTDTTGHVFTSDARFLNLTIGAAGNAVTKSLSSLPVSMHTVLIRNGLVGMERVQILVNTTPFVVNTLGPNEETRLNIASAMLAGQENTITITAEGSVGASAEIAVSNAE